MKTISSREVESRILEATGVAVIAEDREYVLKPAKWFIKMPLLGLRKYFYVEDGCDCDDFNTILKYEWLRRHLKDVEKGASTHGNSHHPGLPVFQVKMEMDGGAYWHWCMLALSESGVHLIERTGDSIRYATRGKILRIHI